MPPTTRPRTPRISRRCTRFRSERPKSSANRDHMSVATKGGNTFLQRNKKKSALALLLLFLRERKILVLLLLLLFMASSVFLTPSSWLTGLPGGARFAAGVAWMAGKL